MPPNRAAVIADEGPMIWPALGAWWVVALGYFFVLAWLNPKAHAMVLALAAAMWPVMIPLHLALALARRLHA